jgi:hypothetical protein
MPFRFFQPPGLLIIACAWLLVAGWHSYLLVAAGIPEAVRTFYSAPPLCDMFFWILEGLVLAAVPVGSLAVLATLPAIVGFGLLRLNARAAFAARLFAIVWALFWLIAAIEFGLTTEAQSLLVNVALLFNIWSVCYLGTDAVKNRLRPEVEPLRLGDLLVKD